MFAPSAPTTTALPFAGGGFPAPTRENLVAQEQMMLEQRAAATQPAQQAFLDAIAKRNSLLANPIPAAREPKFYDVKPPPNQKFLDPMQAFANPLVLLTVLGSLKARGGGLAAMKAATEAINGFHKGDEQVMNREMDNWQKATDAVIKQNNVELSRYNAAIKTTEHNVGERQAKLEAIAASTGDALKLAALRSGNMDGFIDLIDKQRQHVEKMEELSLRYGLGEADDATLRALVQRRMNGEKDVIQKSNIGRGTQGPQNVNRFNAILNEEMTARGMDAKALEQADASYAAAMQFGRQAGGVLLRVEAATTELQTALPLAYQASKDYPRPSNFVKFNELYNKWKQGTSDPQYNDFMTKMTTALNAYVRVMNPMGVPRIAERAELHAVGMLNLATGQAGLEKQMRALWQEAVNSTRAMHKLVEQGLVSQFDPNAAPWEMPGAPGGQGGTMLNADGTPVTSGQGAPPQGGRGGGRHPGVKVREVTPDGG
jgi:hypothetical protein